MTRKKCIYCDTIYPEDAQQCPLCGGTASEPVEVPDDDQIVHTPRTDDTPERAEKPARRSEAVPAVPAAKPPRRAPEPQDAPDPDDEPDEPDSPAGSVPRWMTVLICVVLASALLVGLAFTGYTLGLFDRGGTTKDDPSISLPYDDKDQNGQTPDDQQPDQTPDDTNTPDTNDPQDGQTDPDNTGKDNTTSDPDTTTDPTQNPDDGKEPDTTPDEPKGPQHPCTGVSLNLTDVSLFSKGETFTLKANVKPQDCDEEVVFASSDEAYVTVDNTGKVTAVNGKGGGSVTVTATCGSFSAECIVRLPFAETEDSGSAEGTGAFSLNLTDFTMSRKGEEVEVEVKGFNQLTDTVVWSIDDPSVATLNTLTNTAFVTAVSSGTTYLYATVNGTIKLTCVVRCSSKVSGDATAETGG